MLESVREVPDVLLEVERGGVLHVVLGRVHVTVQLGLYVGPVLQERVAGELVYHKVVRGLLDVVDVRTAAAAAVVATAAAMV